MRYRMRHTFGMNIKPNRKRNIKVYVRDKERVRQKEWDREKEEREEMDKER